MSDVHVTYKGDDQSQTFAITEVPKGSTLMRRLKRRRKSIAEFSLSGNRIEPRPKTVGDLMREINKIDGWEMKII